jgi:hypothetical protein
VMSIPLSKRSHEQVRIPRRFNRISVCDVAIRSMVATPFGEWIFHQLAKKGSCRTIASPLKDNGTALNMQLNAKGER